MNKCPSLRNWGLRFAVNNDIHRILEYSILSCLRHGILAYCCQIQFSIRYVSEINLSLSIDCTHPSVTECAKQYYRENVRGVTGYRLIILVHLQNSHLIWPKYKVFYPHCQFVCFTIYSLKKTSWVIIAISGLVIHCSKATVTYIIFQSAQQ